MRCKQAIENRISGDIDGTIETMVVDQRAARELLLPSSDTVDIGPASFVGCGNRVDPPARNWTDQILALPVNDSFLLVAGVHSAASVISQKPH